MTLDAGPTTVVIGVGNSFRRDDGAAEAVTARVSAALPERLRDTVRVVSVNGESSALVELWDGVDLAVVVDAVHGASAPGVVHHVELSPVTDSEALGVLRAPRLSSHGAGVAEAVALGAELGRVPQRLVVYGIEGADFGEGPGLSAAVEAAVDAVAKRVIDEVGGT